MAIAAIVGLDRAVADNIVFHLMTFCAFHLAVSTSEWVASVVVIEKTGGCKAILGVALGAIII